MDSGTATVGERALVFGATESLTGVMTTPAGDALDPARPVLIILNAGLVHRVGPNRLHVKLARRLAARGFASVRFDFSGIGESLPRADSLPFQQSSVLEVVEVMDAVTALTGIREFCLLGLSSGAMTSFETALEDSRVVGAAAVNLNYADADRWSMHVERLSEGRIYARNLLSAHSWKRILTGKTDYRRLGGAIRYRLLERGRADARVSSVVQAARPRLAAFLDLKIRILLLFSQKDRSIVNFDEILGERWQDGLPHNVTLAVIPEANHTFAGPAHLEEALTAVERWMETGWAVAGATRAG